MANYLIGINFYVIAFTISCETTPPTKAAMAGNFD